MLWRSLAQSAPCHRASQLDAATSIGALMEYLDRGVLDLLKGAQITVSAIG